MATIDERIVSMVFKNAQFEAGVAKTQASLAKLDSSLAKMGKTNGLADIEKSANKVTLNAPMSALDKLKAKLVRGIDPSNISKIEKAGNIVTLAGPRRAIGRVQDSLSRGLNAGKAFAGIEKSANDVNFGGINKAIEETSGNFSLLSGAAAVAMGNIATQMVNVAARGVKQAGSAVTDGFKDYELKIGATQTIMSGTGENIGTVTKYLKDLDIYADRTIYNLRDMTGNIGKFTNAGVKLPVAVGAMKGIANLAALSGANAEEASRAMYNLGQAIGQGKVRMADWRSVDLANMGTKEFKEELIKAAVATGDLKKASDGSLRTTKGSIVNFKTFGATLQDNWLTAEALTNTLNKYSDEGTDLGKRAYAAASDVKTATMMFTTLKASLGTSWTDTFDLIIGDLPEATKLFTSMTNVVGKFFNTIGNARNEALAGWDKLGGRTLMIKALSDGFKALFAVLGTVGKAFREVFPRKSGEDLNNMTKNFANFTKNLTPSAATLDGLKRTFAGFFAILHTGWAVIKGVFGVFGQLIGVLGEGGGGFLNFTGGIGDLLVAIDNALTKGGLLTSFFDTIAKILKVPVALIASFAGFLGGMFSGIDSSGGDKVGGVLGNINKAASPLTQSLATLKIAWDGLIGIFKDAKDFVSPWLEKIAEELGGFGAKIKDALGTGDAEKALGVLQTGFIGAIFLSIKKTLGQGGGFIASLTKTMDSFGEVLGGLTNHLQLMQQQIKVKIILSIAAAIGILAAAIFVLSRINAKDLTKAMTAIALGLGQLMGAMKLMTLGMGPVAVLQLPLMAAGMILLAGSMIVLGAAMKIFATMSWEDLAKGLVGVGGGLAAIGVGMKFLGPGAIIQGPAILVIAIAMNALALAVKQFASLSWEDLGRGLAGVLGTLVALVVPLGAMGPGLLVVGPGLLIVSFALNMLAGAVRSFADIPLKEMATGIGGIAVALIAIGAGIVAIPPTIALQAAGLVILAVALNGIAGAVKIFGSIGLANLAKGLGALAASLVILAFGLTLMVGTLPGAVALMAAALALAVLGPALGFIGQLDLLTIVKGLAAIATVMGVLAVVGLLAGPGLSALGLALVPLAGVLILNATAALIFAKALSLLGQDGKAGIAVMITAVTAFVALFPKIFIEFMKGLVQIADEAAKIAPRVVASIVKIIDQILNVIIQSAPKLAIAIGTLITSFLYVIGANAPQIIAAGYKLLDQLFQGINQNIGKIISQGSELIVKFLSGLATKMPGIIAAGARLVVGFLQGIANNMPKVLTAAVNVAVSFLNGVARGAPRMVAAGARAITSFLNAISQGIPKVMSAGVRIIISFLNGLQQAIPRVAKKASSVARTFLNTLGDTLVGLADIGFKAIIRFLNGIAKAIRDNDKELIDAGANILKAIISGVTQAAGQLAGPLRKAIENLFGMLPKWARKILGIKSPSTVFAEIGGNVVKGMAVGLQSMPGVLQSGISNPISSMLRENYGLREFGTYLGTEFQKGLTGGLFPSGKSAAHEQIEATFTGLRDKLKEQQTKLQEQVKAGEDKLKELTSVKSETKKEQAAAQKEVNKVFAELTSDKRLLEQATTATTKFMASLRDERGALIKLAYDYENVSAALEKAKTALDSATQARDEAIKSYTEQYSQLPAIGSLMDQALAEAQMTAEEKAEAAKKKREENEKRSKINQVELYKKALKQQIVDTQKYMETLKQLREAGLDDTTYKSLLAQGIAGQSFASALLSGGKAGIEELNKLNASLAANAAKLAGDAAKQLYQAGVDAATGLVQGLTNKQAEIRKVMENIASSMVYAIKRQLGIRSPSSVFAEVGKFAAQGMANGLKAATGAVVSTAAAIGDKAADAMTSTLADISNRISSDIDTDLTITPVLDLTQVQKDAKQMQDLTNVTPITAAISYGQAASITEEKATVDVAQAALAAEAGPTFHFEQTNTSPKALSDVEIYRQTKNQLSQVKSVLGLAS